MKTLSASENMLKVVFSDDYDFVIPRYQRPYAWTQEHALELFDDLYEHFQATRNLGDAEKLPYFLGSVVLIKNENAPLAEVIDGQQRLTTLTILFAAMRDQARDADLRADFQALYQSKAQKLKKIAAKPRLTLRECDQAFFNERVQATDDFSAIQTLISSELKTESQKRIYENSLALLSRIQRLLPTDEELGDFGEFLLNRCFLAIVSTPTQESAFRVFSVLNDRGLDLLPCDVLKSEIIGRIEAESQEKYANAWERFERALGRKSFNELFAHVLALYLPNRSQGTLLENFRGRLLKEIATPEAMRRFFDDVLSPCAEYFRDLKRGTLQIADGSNAASPLASYLNALSQVKFSDWIPVALAFLLRRDKQKSTRSNAAEFFRKLERLTSYLYLCSKDVKKRAERFAPLIQELQEPEIDVWRESLELTPSEKREFFTTLDGPVYELPTPDRRRYLLLRLDAFIAETGATYDVKRTTIEHVLPQKPTSEFWHSRWSVEARSRWLHRIANLVPLSGQRNSQARNYDFAKKRDVYFLNGNKTTPYALTAQLLAETDWTPAIVEARQKRLLAAFAKHWELNVCSGSVSTSVSNDVASILTQSLETQKFRLDFWTRFRDKLLAASDLKKTQTPRPSDSFDVRLGTSGIVVSNRCLVAKKQASTNIYIDSDKKAVYLPTLTANRATLENLAGRPLDFAPTPPGKDQVIVLKTFDLEPSDAASVETVLDALVATAVAFRQTLRPLVAEQVANVDAAKVWTLENHRYYADCRELFEYFRAKLVHRFPNIKQDIGKLYVAFKAQKNVVDVEFQKHGLCLYVNLEFSEINAPAGVCNDTTNKGTRGNGNVRIYVQTRSEVGQALHIIAQSYRKNS